MKKILAVLLALFFVVMLVQCGAKEKLDWPSSGLAVQLPEPESKYGKVRSDTSDSLSVWIEEVTERDYRDYLEQCKELGFIIDPDQDLGYAAYNDEGYHLQLRYAKSNEKMSIDLDAPIKFGALQWPNSELSSLIPKPKSKLGKTDWDRATGFFIYVAETSEQDFANYVTACSAAGFTVDYNKGEDYYRAKDAAGNSLSLDYEGFRTMTIRLEAAEQIDEAGSSAASSQSSVETVAPIVPEKPVQQPEPEAVIPETAPEEPVKEEAPEAEPTGIRPEFKAAMDSYEAFFDEYVAFMRKYANADPTDALMLLSDYADYMDQYADTMEKLSALDDGTLSSEELDYYIEVYARITQKLLDAAQ
ncbi:MAG: hypothetical protein KH009_02995 [Clostridiales bacterium]|nr:hypothetical protein [Clostridiales bacterium]